MAEGRRSRVARLLAGGILGAAVVVSRRRRGSSMPGLGAFEGAPCFRAGSQPDAPPSVDRPAPGDPRP